MSLYTGGLSGLPRAEVILFLLGVGAGMASSATWLLTGNHNGAIEVPGGGILMSRPLKDEDIDASFAALERVQRSVSDAVAARIEARAAGRQNVEPFLYITFEHPKTLHQGDEGRLLLTVTCHGCSEDKLQLAVMSKGLEVVPGVIPMIDLKGDTSEQIPVILSSTTTGTKNALISAGLLSGKQMPTGVATIEVLPPTIVLGIPQPYVDLLGKISALVGLPTLTALMVTFLIKRRRKPRRRP